MHFIKNSINELLVDLIFCNIFIVGSGQFFIGACRIQHDILERRILPLQGSAFPVHIRQDLPEQIEYLCICGTGQAPVRKMKPGSNCFGSFRFSRTGRATKEKVPHGLYRVRSDFCVFTDPFDFLRDDIPVRQYRDGQFLLRSQHTGR